MTPHNGTAHGQDDYTLDTHRRCPVRAVPVCDRESNSGASGGGRAFCTQPAADFARDGGNSVREWIVIACASVLWVLLAVWTVSSWSASDAALLDQYEQEAAHHATD